MHFAAKKIAIAACSEEEEEVLRKIITGRKGYLL